MNLRQIGDTIVALATAPAIGAIGVIRLSGTESLNIISQIFLGKELKEQKTHTIHFGTIVDQDQNIIDEVLISLFIAPKSYTGEDVIEISCHGSPFIIQRIIELIIKHGARMANPGEFTMRAFLNGKLDLSQAEAVADLIASDSDIKHDLAIKQMRGGFSKNIQMLRDELIKFASLIELELDFGEEDVEFANRKELKERLNHILSTIEKLIHSFKMGNVIKNGISTVIAGRPNAGKSTLLNALLNEDRAIVSEIAGTTRDTIEEKLTINGLQFRLIDTAGIREATDAIEEIGVKKTMEKIQSSSILVYVFDVIATPPNEVIEEIEALSRENQTIVAVANKMDLNPYTKPEWYVNTNLPIENIVTTSAKNEMNIEYLKTKLVEVALNGNNLQDQSIVTNTRHYEALEGARESLRAALDGMNQGVTSDFVAIDIRRATHYLGLISGEISSDDLLDSIFRDFCIGK